MSKRRTKNGVVDVTEVVKNDGENVQVKDAEKDTEPVATEEEKVGFWEKHGKKVKAAALIGIGFIAGCVLRGGKSGSEAGDESGDSDIDALSDNTVTTTTIDGVKVTEF